MNYTLLFEQIRKNNWFAEQKLLQHVRDKQFRYLANAFRDQTRAEDAFQLLMVELFECIRKDKIEHPDALLFFSYKIAARMRAREFERREKESARVIPFSMLSPGVLKTLKDPQRDQEQQLLDDELQIQREKEFKRAMGVLSVEEKAVVRAFCKGVPEHVTALKLNRDPCDISKMRRDALDKLVRAIQRNRAQQDGEFSLAA